MRFSPWNTCIRPANAVLIVRMNLSNLLLLLTTITQVLGEYAPYRRQDNGEVSVSTIPESVTTSTSIYTTEGAEGGETPTEVTAPSTTTAIDITRTVDVKIDAKTESTVTFNPSTTQDEDGSTYVFDPTTTTIQVPETTLSTQIAEVQTVITANSYVTEIEVGTTKVAVTVPSTTTTVTLPLLDTTVTVTGTTALSTTFINVPATEQDTPGNTKSFSVSTVLNIPLSTATVTISSTTVTVTIPSTTTSITITGESGPETVTSVTTITIPESLVTYTVEGTSSEETSGSESTEDTSSSGEESSDTSGTTDTTDTTETTESTESTEGTETTDTTSETSETSESSTSSESGSPVPTPTLPAGTNPTYCEAVRGPLTPEEEVQLAVLFGDSSGGTTFADYVVSYASQLVAQIADVANIAVGDNDYAFTTAFDSIDIPGVLGLASAAPIYTCFLSTLWAQALSNPQQYARRAIPSQDEKIKLIVLFEKRATDGMQFDYAELLVDDTNNLIAEVQSVAGAAGAAAVGGDLGAYASLFANVDVAQFLSIATEAPVYTEGLSSAFVTALESYSQNVNRPTSTIMTTHTYTTVSTIVTNVVSGTVTVPTTLFSTVVVTSVGPATSGRETYTSHTTETRVGVTSETVSEVVRESTLPNGQVTRVTERITVGVPGTASPTAAVPAPGERVTVEVVTGANGRVETRTVTIREETRAPAPAQTTRRPNVAVYTQVQNGRTYTHTVEIQTRNNAFKQVLALGAGLFGGLILLL